MKTSENKFEQSWKDAFGDARLKPDESVWTKIDSTLANIQIKRYRRKLLFYKMLVAATVVIAMGLAYYSFHNVFFAPGSAEKESMAQKDHDVVRKGDKNESDEEKRDIPPGTNEERIHSDRPANSMEFTPEKKAPVTKEPVDRALLTAKKKNTNVSDEKNKSLPQAYLDEFIHPVSSKPVEAENYHPVMPDPPGKKKNPFVNPLFEEPESESQESNTTLWAGLDLSSGVFDPNISYGPRSSLFGNQANFRADNAYAAPMSLNSADFSYYPQSAVPEETDYEPAFSYAYGMNFGLRFNKRLMIASGLSYMYSNASTKVSSYVENTVSNQKTPNQLTFRENSTFGLDSYNSLPEDIKLNISYEFVTLPLRFGYFLIDKKIKWALTTGLSADFFLKSKVYDNGDFFQKTEFTSGETSPYKKVYFNGSVGSMVNYSLSKNYRISLEPVYRIGINYLTREEAAFNSRPASFLITAGMSYVFK